MSYRKNIHDIAWEYLFEYYQINKHNFEERPYYITAKKIKEAMKKKSSKVTSEPRILCKYDKKENRPEIFKQLGLFILPIKNGYYALIKGEGYIELPKQINNAIEWKVRQDIMFDSIKVGDSEMQHIDFAFAQGIIKDFFELDNLHLMIRGRKFGTKFEFFVGKHRIIQNSTQIEVDAGYENEDNIILIEGKSNLDSSLKDTKTNLIARQCYYPYRFWSNVSNKNIIIGVFDKKTFVDKFVYDLWQLKVKKHEVYNSFEIVKYKRYIVPNPL